jgi:hypothetical protein
MSAENNFCCIVVGFVLKSVAEVSNIYFKLVK